MMRLRGHSLLMAFTVLLVVYLSSQVQGEETKLPSKPQEALRLEDLEQMALKNNPTIQQASAFVHSAEGQKVQAEAEQQAQIQRVLNTVRLLYYRVLGTQRLVELRSELTKIAREAVDISAGVTKIG